MRLVNFEVRVREGTESDDGYVRLPHGTQYTLSLGNHLDRRCDARVEVDGKEVGTFRLNGFENALLEHPPNDAGRFTFYKADTAEGEAVGADKVGRDDRGLIRVTFTPEKERPPILRTGGVIRSMNMSKGGPCGQSMDKGMSFAPEEKTAAGVTGLTGHSSQTFHTVGPIDYDESLRVVITLRLVAVLAAPTVRELVGAAAGNPVPPPV